MQDESDWQGFETFHEQPECLLKFVQPALPLNPPKKYIISHKKYLSQSDKKKNRKPSMIQIQHKDKDYEQITVKNQSYQQYTYPKRAKELIKHQRKINLRFPQDKAERIPIIKVPEVLLPSGLVLYRFLHPKTSNAYFSSNKSEQPQEIQSDDLYFSSKFESGNLNLALKIKPQEYNLYMKPDTNTRGHKQWFYFSVRSKNPQVVKFNIFNFRKKISLFQSGMKPYGRMRNEQEWQPLGRDVKYIKQDQEDDDKVKNKFHKQNEEWQIASCIPYTYTFLYQQIRKFQQHIAQNNVSQISFCDSTLCKTLSGMKVPLLSIFAKTSFKNPKKYIIINARTHPGQTSSSWVLDGLLNKVAICPKIQQKLRRNNIVLKIVPMLNPDGVYMGNYRTGVIGIDYNRAFLSAKQELFPQILALRQLVKECKADGRVELYLDLHGHSILKGSFLFGPSQTQFRQFSLRSLENNLMKSKYFSSQNCVMHSDPKKIETSRIFFQLRQDILALTLQNSLGLYLNEKGRTVQYLCKDWRKFGEDLLDCIIEGIAQEQQDYEWSKLNLTSERFNIKKSQIIEPEDDEFVWTKSKTEDENLSKNINLMLQMEKNSVSFQNNTRIQSKKFSEVEDIEEANDSDNSSQDLSMSQKKDLFIAVRLQINKPKPEKEKLKVRRKSIQEQEDSKESDDEFMKKNNKGFKLKVINKFKEYRFGSEESQNCLANWQKHRRLFSVPKPIRSETTTNSFLIRRTAPKPKLSSEFILESMDFVQRIKTEISMQPAGNKSIFGEKRVEIKKIGPKQEWKRNNEVILQHLLSKKS